jgi:hypothetical protein
MGREVPQVKRVQRFVVASQLVGLLLWLGACASQTPQERIAALRSHYKVDLNGFLIKETPLGDTAAAPAEPGAEPAAEPAAEPGAEPGAAPAPAGTGEAGGEAEAAAPPAVRTDLLLDLVVQHDTRDQLPGITVDVTEVDAQQREKAHWRVWIDTAGLPQATQKQVSHTV